MIGLSSEIPLVSHSDVTSPFPPSGNEGYTCNRDVFTICFAVTSSPAQSPAQDSISQNPPRLTPAHSPWSPSVLFPPPVTANQAPYILALSPLSHCLVSQLAMLTYLIPTCFQTPPTTCSSAPSFSTLRRSPRIPWKRKRTLSLTDKTQEPLHSPCTHLDSLPCSHSPACVR